MVNFRGQMILQARVICHDMRTRYFLFKIWLIMYYSKYNVTTGTPYDYKSGGFAYHIMVFALLLVYIPIVPCYDIFTLVRKPIFWPPPYLHPLIVEAVVEVECKHTYVVEKTLINSEKHPPRGFCVARG